MSVFDSFGALDEVIQVIYQGADRFVVLSNVDFGPLNPGWDVHVGLSGDTGCWWSGRWTEADVESVAGTTTSATLLEAFAEKLAGTFVNGELFIGDWNGVEDSKEMKIAFGSTAKRPLSMGLKQMSPEESATYTSNAFFTIGLAAQSRKCQLNPPSFPSTSTRYESTSGPSDRGPPPRKERKKSSSPPPRRPSADKPRASERNRQDSSSKEAEEEIKALRAQLADAQRQQDEGNAASGSSGQIGKLGNVGLLPKTAKGAPGVQKRARKFTEMAFDDD